MIDIVDKLPPNMERVLMTDGTTFGFAFVKDGMYKWDDTENWNQFDRNIRGVKWITITDLKKTLNIF